MSVTKTIGYLADGTACDYTTFALFNSAFGVDSDLPTTLTQVINVDIYYSDASQSTFFNETSRAPTIDHAGYYINYKGMYGSYIDETCPSIGGFNTVDTNHYLLYTFSYMGFSASYYPMTVSTNGLSSPRIFNCFLKSTSGSAIDFYSIGGCIIVNSILTANSNESCIVLSYCRNTTIKDCVLVGGSLVGMVGAEGINIDSCTNVSADYCFDISAATESTEINIINSILYAPSLLNATTSNTFTKLILFKNSCVYQTSYAGKLSFNNSPSDEYGSLSDEMFNNSILSNPLFVNTSGNLDELADFALQDTSPCKYNNITQSTNPLYLTQKTEHPSMGAWTSYVAPTADEIVKSAGGNWNDDNLSDQADFTDNVRKDVVGGLGWTGGYDPSVPDEPTVGTLVEGSDSVTIPITVTDQSVYTYARYRTLLTGSWSAESPSFRVLGDGDIVITGLDSTVAIEITFYSKESDSTDITSTWTDPVTAFNTMTGGASQTGVGDEAYFVVKRQIGGVERRYIERLSLRFIDNDVSPESAYFVDCGLTYSGEPADEISGLGHLEGEEVSVLADGNVVNGLTVSGGSITLPFEASLVHIGLPYSCTLETLDYDLQIEGANTIHNRERNVNNVTIKLKDTRELNIGADEDSLEEQPFRTDEEAGEPTRLFSGDKDIPLQAGVNGEAVVMIKNNDPLPIEVLSIIADLEVGDV